MHIDKINISPLAKTCCACGTEFIFSVDEQLKYLASGYHPPKRCKKCRSTNRIIQLNEITESVKLGCKTSSFFQDAQVFGQRTNVKTSERYVY
jgi:hypothetical protein